MLNHKSARKTLLKAGESFILGILKGLSGVIMKPIKGRLLIQFYTIQKL